MYRKILIVTNVLLLLDGCELKKDTAAKKVDTKKADIKSVNINGSPNPPKGYKRPIVDIKHIIKK